jgi:hypothetical protein
MDPVSIIANFDEVGKAIVSLDVAVRDLVINSNRIPLVVLKQQLERIFDLYPWLVEQLNREVFFYKWSQPKLMFVKSNTPKDSQYNRLASVLLELVPLFLHCRSHSQPHCRQ